jgi:hypothetical protein
MSNLANRQEQLRRDIVDALRPAPRTARFGPHLPGREPRPHGASMLEMLAADRRRHEASRTGLLWGIDAALEALTAWRDAVDNSHDDEEVREWSMDAISDLLGSEGRAELYARNAGGAA